MPTHRIAITGLTTLLVSLSVLLFFAQFQSYKENRSIIGSNITVPFDNRGPLISRLLSSEDIIHIVRLSDVPIFREMITLEIPKKISISDSPFVKMSYLRSHTTASNVTAMPQSISAELTGGNFEILPSGIITQAVTPDDEAHFAWNINPKKLGSSGLLLRLSGASKQVADPRAFPETTDYAIITSTAIITITGNQIRIASGEPLTFNIEVVDTFGIPSSTGKVLGYIGTFGGTALTLPWIYGAWEKWRTERKKQRSPARAGAMKRNHKQGPKP